MSSPIQKPSWLLVHPIAGVGAGNLITFYQNSSDGETTTDEEWHKAGWYESIWYPLIEPLGDISKPFTSDSWVLGETYCVTIDQTSDWTVTGYTIWTPYDETTSIASTSRDIKIIAVDEEEEDLGVIWEYSGFWAWEQFHSNDQNILETCYRNSCNLTSSSTDREYTGRANAIKIRLDWEDTLFSDKDSDTPPARGILVAGYGTTSLPHGMIG